MGWPPPNDMTWVRLMTAQESPRLWRNQWNMDALIQKAIIFDRAHSTTLMTLLKCTLISSTENPPPWFLVYHLI
jgi:hypothetical protein